MHSSKYRCVGESKVDMKSSKIVKGPLQSQPDGATWQGSSTFNSHHVSSDHFKKVKASSTRLVQVNHRRSMMYLMTAESLHQVCIGLPYDPNPVIQFNLKDLLQNHINELPATSLNLIADVNFVFRFVKHKQLQYSYCLHIHNIIYIIIYIKVNRKLLNLIYSALPLFLNASCQMSCLYDWM